MCLFGIHYPVILTVHAITLTIDSKTHECFLSTCINVWLCKLLIVRGLAFWYLRNENENERRNV